MADRPVKITVDQNKNNLRNAVTQAVIDLDNIVLKADTATVAQLRWAIKRLAQNQKHIIKRLIQVK